MTGCHADSESPQYPTVNHPLFPAALMAGVLVMALPPVPIQAAEPTGASLAWTSNDPVVAQARDLVKAGKLAEAEALLRTPDAKAGQAALAARGELVELIPRVRYDYSLTARQITDTGQRTVPGLTVS